MSEYARNLDRQRVWDECLILAWHLDVKMAVTLGLYEERLKTGRYNAYCSGAEKITAALKEDGLKRWSYSKHEMVVFTQPVRGFIASRCPTLSACLWKGGKGNTAQECVEAIDKFKWVYPAARRRPPRPKEGGRFTIRNLRERDKRHNWTTVK